MSVVVLPPLGPPVDRLWHLLLDLGEMLSVGWTIVGGQMVLLHALEHGQVPPQISQDGDLIADIRADRGALAAVVKALHEFGFALAGIAAGGVAHRFERPGSPKPVVIDVLAPEGVGARADLSTEAPGRTIEVPGGTQALARTEHVEVQHESRRGTVPRPSLLGAVVAKGAACALPGDNSRHLRDLALLCALIEDPFEMSEQMTSKDRRRVLDARVLLDSGHSAWQLVPAAIRAQGCDAYEILGSR